MTDQLVSQVKLTDTSIMDARPASKLIPTYLVLFEDKKAKNFISIKLDEHPAYVKMVGFYTDKSDDEIKVSFEELIKNTAKTALTEIMLPWHNVKQIISLVFRPR